jgi:ABC-type uncharacterized transport system permease subunit
MTATRLPSPATALRVSGTVRWIAGFVAALVIFALFILVQGKNPVAAYADMFTSTFTQGRSLGSILVRATPLIFAALAVAVPARAGLVNVGGEGQLLLGGVAAAGTALALGPSIGSGVSLPLMALAAAAAGAVLAGVAVGLRVLVGISEAVTTLLLNYIALNIQRFLIFDRWKDPRGSGQPATPPLQVAERLPVIGTSRVHVGIVLAVVAAGVIAFLFARTRWGFRLRVVGGNPEAARRAGMPTGKLLASSMLLGGALAGLGGFAHLAGAEFTLRQGFLAGYGYVAFLAAWLARHRPGPVAASAVLLAGIALAGDSLQIDTRLPAASVNVLMALVLLITFGYGRRSAT